MAHKHGCSLNDMFPLFLCSLTCWWRRCGQTVKPHPITRLARPQPLEMKAFLSCTTAGLQGACRGPVYLCNNVIKGSVVTRPSLCTFPLSTSSILPLVPIRSPPLLLPALSHHPQSFSLSLIIIQILLLTLVDLRICLMWSWQGERWSSWKFIV